MATAVTDVWSSVAELDEATQTRLAGVLETRGANPQQQAMRQAFLSDVELPAGADVLDVGCGTGVLTRQVARRPDVGLVEGVDSAPSLLERAREHASELPNVRFREADARELPFGGGSFDVVLFDSTLSHVAAPESALAEAFRVLRPEGRLGVFDGDYATATVALGDHDPLQVCVDAMMANSVTDPWLMRRLPAMAAACGFEIVSFRGHSLVETAGAEYMLTVVDRGADLLASGAVIGPAAAAELKRDARRRVESRQFFGHISYTALVGRKPGSAPTTTEERS